MLQRRLAPYLSGLPPAFWTLWVGTLINRLGSFVLPFLTLFLTLRRGVSPAAAAGLVGFYGLGAFASSLVGGVVADRLGRRAAIVTSLFGGAVAMLVVPWIEDMAALAVTVAVLGFLAELYRPGVAAAVTDLVAPADRPRAFALLYWVINVGAAAAPVIAGLVAARSYLALFVADAVTMALYGGVVLWWVPETRPAPEEPSSRNPLPGLATALRDPLLLGVAAGTFLTMSIFFQSLSTLPLAMTGDGLSEASYGLAIGTNGLLIVLASLPIAHLVGRRAPLPMLALAAVVTGVGFALTAPASTVAAYAATVAVWTLGEIVMAPVAPSLVGELAPRHLRGAYQGVHGAGIGLAFLAGPMVGGWVFERFGGAVLWPGCLAVGLAAAALFLALGPLARQRRAGAATTSVAT